MRFRAVFLAFLLTGVVTGATVFAQRQNSADANERILLHKSADWALILPHLPDPATATEAQLETAADVLQARRFPEDALDYYQYAMKRGGNTVDLMKKMGVVRLELQQGNLARAIFQRCTQLAPKDSQSWNNLAAADYTLGSYRSAIGEYKRAVKLNKKSAVYHANLGMAYFSIDEVESARAQFNLAMHLDPNIMEGMATGGVTLHVLQTKDYAKLCFEMAKMYAVQGQMATTKLWLEKAAEHGIDLRAAMNEDATLRPLMKNADFKMLLTNSERLHKRLAVSTLPTLGTGTDPVGVPN